VFYDRMQVSLIDNGRGWESQGEGQGLQAMRARASVIGAKVDFLPVSDGGLELRVTLPMRHERHVDLSSTA
jgi:signal transduction histidine kinase